MSREMGIIQGDTFGDFVSSVQKVGNCFRADYRLVCLMKMEIERSRRPTRALVVDENTILIDGKRVEGLTRLQLRILAFIVERERATLDDLTENVWCDPDTKDKSIRSMVRGVSNKLEN
ncbi:MAG: hypothetical protein Q4D62_07600 [Planctomycetia bacterium]|nr:hypothetical protein [Planctomycetia bacterium]